MCKLFFSWATCTAFVVRVLCTPATFGSSLTVQFSDHGNPHLALLAPVTTLCPYFHLAMFEADMDFSDDECIFYAPAHQCMIHGSIRQEQGKAAEWLGFDSLAAPNLAGPLCRDTLACGPMLEAALPLQLTASFAQKRATAHTHRCTDCGLMFPASKVLIEMSSPSGVIERCFHCLQYGPLAEHVSAPSMAASRPRSEAADGRWLPRFAGTDEQALRAFNKASSKARLYYRVQLGEQVKKRPRTQNYEKAKAYFARTPKESSRQWRKQVCDRAKFFAMSKAAATSEEEACPTDEIHMEPVICPSTVTQSLIHEFKETTDICMFGWSLMQLLL